VNKLTTKNIYTQIVKEIEKRVSYNTKSSYNNQTSRSFATSFGATSDATTAELVSAIQDLLKETLPSTIISGLEVEETNPISNTVTVNSGRGAVGGVLYELTEDIILQIPFDSVCSVFYIVLYNDMVMVEKTYNSEKLTIAKIVVPKPGVTNLIQDDKDESWNAYIVNFKEFKLYGYNDKFEEDTIELLRDNISPILADNLIGNIRLSENLKIINTQGTVELDSSELRLLSTNETTLAKFNRNGTFFYDDNGIEIARFTTDDAKIGNILVTKNSVQSGDYISESSGFKISDNGFAEFENVRVRGRISSSVFESDRISAVGGKLYVGNSSVLSTDVDSSNTTITVENSVFFLNEVLTIKDGTNQEWMLVTDVSDAPTYIVSRDISDSYITNPSWNKGTAIVSTGVGGSGYTESGFILLDAISNYSPFIDINLRDSEVYDDVTTKVRLGNLAGITDSLYGTLSGYGLYSDNVYLRGKLYAPDIKTAISGSRGELNTCCFTVYDSAGCQVFDIKYGGTNLGDVTIGDLQSQYMFWDNSLDKITLKSASDGTCFELSDGNIISNSITLKDPLCECCYSYLSSGQWYFHDELGNSTPYVKRLCAGEINTGSTICLSGWRGQPYIQIGIKDLAAYDPNYSVNCQKWCVYYDNLECYCNSDGSYGWCFDAHASLYKVAGVYDEATQDVAIDTSVFTHSDAAWTRVRNRFLLWCFASASSTCYWYGILSYQIKYKCCLAGCTWTCCTYSYTQPHDSTVTLKTCYDVCQNICFPSAGCWELQLNCLSLTWCLTTLDNITYCCCCRVLNCCSTIAERVGSISHYQEWYVCNCCNYLSLTGYSPSCVYCAYLCYCSCVRMYGIWLGGGNSCCTINCFCSTLGTVNLENRYLCYTWINSSTSHECVYTNCSCVNLDIAYDYSCLCMYRMWCLRTYADMSLCIGISNIIYGMYVIQCYCSIPSDTVCDYERFWSLKDYSETQTILDPNGTLNYLAIGYN
jgi:hypothetical protein